MVGAGEPGKSPAVGNPGVRIHSTGSPCTGVKGNKESGRDVYVEDEPFAKAYEHADRPLRYAMAPAYLVGQRVH